MGDKSAARQLAFAAGVPVVWGYDDSEQSDERLETAAREIGFPLMVKAAAGGGGKGMRIVERERDLLEALAAARREAQSAFGARDFAGAAIREARHRVQSSATRRATSFRSSSANVRSSGGIRRSSRRRPPSRSRRSCARAWARPPSRSDDSLAIPTPARSSSSSRPMASYIFSRSTRGCRSNIPSQNWSRGWISYAGDSVTRGVHS